MGGEDEDRDGHSGNEMEGGMISDEKESGAGTLMIAQTAEPESNVDPSGGGNRDVATVCVADVDGERQVKKDKVEIGGKGYGINQLSPAAEMEMDDAGNDEAVHMDLESDDESGNSRNNTMMITALREREDVDSDADSESKEQGKEEDPLRRAVIARILHERRRVREMASSPEDDDEEEEMTSGVTQPTNSTSRVMVRQEVVTKAEIRLSPITSSSEDEEEEEEEELICGRIQPSPQRQRNDPPTVRVSAVKEKKLVPRPSVSRSTVAGRSSGGIDVHRDGDAVEAVAPSRETAEAPRQTGTTARSRPIATAHQKQYIDRFVEDLHVFASHPPEDWPTLDVSVGQKDGTWKIICDHFIQNGIPLINTYVRLREDICKKRGVKESSFVRFTDNVWTGAYMPWRYKASGNLAHIVKKMIKDDANIERVWIRLRLRPREVDKVGEFSVGGNA